MPCHTLIFICPAPLFGPATLSEELGMCSRKICELKKGTVHVSLHFAQSSDQENLAVIDADLPSDAIFGVHYHAPYLLDYTMMIILDHVLGY